MDDEGIRLKETIALHTKAIREKLRSLKGSKFETQRVMSEALEPVTSPLKAMLKLQEKSQVSDNGEKEQEEEEVMR